MPKATNFITDYLNHFFVNSTLANYGDATGLVGSTGAGNLYISLHTADPGKAGDQTTSEATYTGYARVAVVRSAGGWTVASPNVTNAALITFATCTAGTNTITHIGVGTLTSGAGKLLYYAPFSLSNQGAATGATNNNITIPGHTLVVNDTIMFYAAYQKALPGGITSGTQYFVKTAATDVITIAATQGGTVITITTSGDAVCYKVSTLAVSVNIAPQIAAGQLSITED